MGQCRLEIEECWNLLDGNLVSGLWSEIVEELSNTLLASDGVSAERIDDPD